MSAIRSLASLNDSKLVNVLREKKKNQRNQRDKRVRNLMTTLDNYLVVWESEDCCLLLKSLTLHPSSSARQEKFDSMTTDDCFLKISLTDPPVFKVDDIQANLSGSLVVLSGAQGVMCVELPTNLASLAANPQGISEKIAKCSYIDEQLLNYNTRIRIQQVKFHPGSPTNSHLVILTSDNCIRIYDVSHPVRPEKTIPVGPKAANLSTSLRSTSFTSCVDLAVSFDFGPPFQETRNNRNHAAQDSVPIFLFPIYVLLDSGDVYTFSCSVQSNSSRAPKIAVAGPLLMQPASLDNYGNDACSILCLFVSPPVLVIANRTGNIHHAVLLPRDAGVGEDDDSDAVSAIQDDLESLISKASKVSIADIRADSMLYVTETLELDGDILEDDSNGLNVDETTESNLHLLKDPSCSSRYFVTHDYGVHGVVVPLVDTLSDLASKNDQDVNQDDTKRVMLAETVVEFLLCSRMKTSAPAPPQGVILHPLPPTLVTLLDSADVQVVSLSPLLKPAIKSTGSSVDTTKVVKESFESLIRRQLHRTHSQPKLSLPPGTELPMTEVVKLFSRSIQTLREEYIIKQDVAGKEIEKRQRLLNWSLQQQFDELELVQQSRAELTSLAHGLAEKYEDAKETQERLTKRVENVVREFLRRSPVMTDAEKQMGQQLRLIATKLQSLSQAMESVRRKEQIYGAKAAKQATGCTNGGHLTEEQRSSIHEALALQSEDVASLMKSLQQAKKKFIV